MANEFLYGQWYIHYSTFPMWLKGDKCLPTFHYAPGRHGQIEDTVRYSKKGRLKSIKGTDFPVAGKLLHFIWRGKGLLYLLKSRWHIVYVSPQQDWMIIAFSASLLTPAGYDIVAKKQNLSDAERIDYVNQFQQLIPNVPIQKVAQASV